MEALRVQDLDLYEAHSQSAWVESVGALEWAVKYCLERFCSERIPSERLKELDRLGFDRLLQTLKTSVQPPLSDALMRELDMSRRWRNSIQHQAQLAPHRDLVKAFTAIRRFMVDYLPITEERLHFVSTGVPAVGAPAARVEETPETAHAPHRQKGGEAWIAQQLSDGLAKLRSGPTRGYDATIASLEVQAADVLTRHALRLLDARMPAGAGLGDVSGDVEAEVKQLLLQSAGRNLVLEEAERLRHLVPLASRFPGLCVEAGWLALREGELGFADPALAALLVGRHIIRSRTDTSRVRMQVARDQSWADAAWLAVTEGDDVVEWVRLLLEGQELHRFPDQVVATCAALGGLPNGTAASSEMVQAFRICVVALVWFAPRRANPLNRRADEASPWYLPIKLWHRCVLDLARASSVLRSGLTLPVDEAFWADPPMPLQQVLSALSLPLRLSPSEAHMVAVACAPFQAVAQKQMDIAFFKQLFKNDDRAEPLTGAPFLPTWMRELGIPALKGSADPEALSLLAFTREGGGPAGYLLRTPSLTVEWTKAWRARAAAEPQRAIETWTVAVQAFLNSPDWPEPSKRSLLIGCPAQLDEMGIRAEAFESLRLAFAEEGLPVSSTVNEAATRAQGEVLRLLALTAPQWRELIERWTSTPALPWKMLLEAGAPQDAIARWCIEKLIEREKAPPAYRDGPVGIISLYGAEVLASNAWQMAFQQASEALEWILVHGDASAISTLAEACLHPVLGQERVNPEMGRFAGMTIPLSQALWGRVISRPAGREALYMHVEHGRVLGDLHFMNHPLPDIEQSLWQAVVMKVLESHHGELTQVVGEANLDPVGFAEANRLFACFEKWLSTQSSSRSPDEPWAHHRLFGLQQTKSTVVALCAMFGVDVSRALRTLLRDVAALLPARPPESGVPTLLGHSLWHLQRRHTKICAELLDEILTLPLMPVMCSDGTEKFWSVFLRQHGGARALALVESLGIRDLGLGFLDGLLEVDMRLLRAEELRAELLRPILIRASQRRFVPSPSFWKRAWTSERSPADIPELVQMAAGPWLDHLLEQSLAWQPLVRRAFLQHLATFSSHEDVRHQCIGALLK